MLIALWLKAIASNDIEEFAKNVPLGLTGLLKQPVMMDDRVFRKLGILFNAADKPGRVS